MMISRTAMNSLGGFHHDWSCSLYDGEDSLQSRAAFLMDCI